MGLFQTLYQFLHPNELRDAVRKSYREHRLHSSLPVETPPHRAGLYGALRESYRVRGKSVSELYLWAELTPFLLMTEDTACEALAEYIVYQQIPSRARTVWLTKVLSAVLCLPALSKSSPRTMASMAMIKNVAWCKLLEDGVRGLLEQEVKELNNALEDSKLPLPQD